MLKLEVSASAQQVERDLMALAEIDEQLGLFPVDAVMRLQAIDV